MNNIIEQLRIPGDEVFSTRRKWLLADLIEQQAARIAELEAWRDSWVKCPEGAAAQRIKELEAELGAGHLQCIADRQKYKQELAALHKRIEDAPRYGTDMDMIYVEDLQK